MARRKKHSTAEVRRLVEAFEASGMTRGQYAASVGMAVATLDSYRRPLRARRNDTDPDQQPKLVRVQMARAVTPVLSGASFRVTLSSGVQIESGWDFQDDGLLRLVRLLATAAV